MAEAPKKKHAKSTAKAKKTAIKEARSIKQAKKDHKRAAEGE
ncbi:hypothetical protein Pth03_48440 [Planotetraspora thailandica]|uniref:Uncharacterized protein n=1 Tax=Planotetraspora thailandica TaxID=487172 RepID=A0A8J3V5J1_9ACTN|nr:hypothetical protein [Planotetraspora thailandica]GII56455.1 hypothetical protein Pth03_48440 [Planotetraspora thailandica]